jgi:RND superfamily putative drug exporter
VLVSGLTVVAAMAGILLSGLLLFDGIGLAMITVVVIVMIGSVTVLPALLSMLGDRVELGRIPLLHGARRRARQRAGGRFGRLDGASTGTPADGSTGARAGGGRLWRAVLARVLARPGAFATLSVLILLALAAPALGMRTEKLSVDQQLSPDSALVQSYHRISAAFPGRPALALTVVRARDIDAAPVRQAIASFGRAAQATGELSGAVSVDVHRAANVAEIQVPLAGDGSGAVSRHALHTLREQVVPSVFGKVPGVEAVVGGELASSLDFNGQLRRSIVPVFLFVTVLAFLLMLISFRSVVVASTSIALNLLSVGAAYGVMVGLFQHGWGASVFGIHLPGRSSPGHRCSSSSSCSASRWTTTSSWYPGSARRATAACRPGPPCCTASPAAPASSPAPP